jgi:hypothetical protein
MIKVVMKFDLKDNGKPGKKSVIIVGVATEIGTGHIQNPNQKIYRLSQSESGSRLETLHAV